MQTRSCSTAALGGVVAALVGTGFVVPAGAAPGDPVGQCPPGYTLTDATFGPATMALDVAPNGNHDGWICRKPATHGPNVGTANIIDNSIPLNVEFP